MSTATSPAIAVALLAVLFLLTIATNVVAAGFNCPDPPQQVAKDVVVDNQGKVAALGKLGSVELKNKTELMVKDLLAKYPNSDRLVIAQMLMSNFCQFISTTTGLTDKEKADRIERFNNQIIDLISRPTSEPRGQAPKAALEARSSEERLPEIRATGTPPWSSDVDCLRQNASRAFLQSGRTPYALRTFITAGFSTMRYNSQADLHSLSILRVSGAGKLQQVEKRADTLSDEPERQLKWVVCLVFEGPPEANLPLKFRLGPVTQNIRISTVPWKALSFGGARGYQADGQVALRLADPAWGVLRSARLLPTRTQGASLLEVIIENRSSEPIALDAVTVRASQKNATDCGRAGSREGPPQQVTFAWTKTIDGSKASDVWTTIGGTDVAAQAELRLRGCGTDTFSATIPIDHVVDAGQLSRIKLLLSEPPDSRTLNVIQQWSAFEVGLLPGGTVLPETVSVQRDQSIFPHSPQRPEKTNGETGERSR